MRLQKYITTGLVFAAFCGCGTTKWSDTSRTATEQLLISYAIDHTVEQLNFCALSGKKVYVSTEAIQGVTDFKYISTTVRQHIASCGGLVCDTEDSAEYVVELRAGAVGTDRNDLLFGVPAFTIPSIGIGGTVTTGSTIPEIPFAKKTDQRAVCKIAVFAYERESGKPIWISGNRQSESRAKAWWVLGTGPFNKGSIYNGTEFAGGKLPEIIGGGGADEDTPSPPLTTERYFPVPKKSEPEPITPPQPAVIATAPEKTENPAPVPDTQPQPPKISDYGGIDGRM